MPPKTKGKAAANGIKGGNTGPQSARAKSAAAEEVVESPNWPVLRPLVPSSDIALDTLLEGQIVLIHKFFTSSLCQQYVSFLSNLPLTTTPGQPKKGDAVRVNDRFQIQDAAFAELLWSATSLKELVTQASADWGGNVCGLNPNIRIYRYRKGQFFDQHYDETNLVSLPGSGVGAAPVAARTTWTLLIYLTGPSSGCVGGETVFYPDEGTYGGTSRKGKTSGGGPISVSPETGMALLHKHGNDCMLHEGRTVEAGEKWIIRSDLCVLR